MIDCQIDIKLPYKLIIIFLIFLTSGAIFITDIFNNNIMIFVFNICIFSSYSTQTIQLIA
jgi:hypothetical protein